MRLDAVDIPGGGLTAIKRNKLMVVHEYAWTDSNHVQEMKKGVLTLEVKTVCGTKAQRDALEEKCGQEGSKVLYFPSAMGADDDRYYTVYTSDVDWSPVTAGIYKGSFTATAPDPYPYVTATDERVYG